MCVTMKTVIIILIIFFTGLFVYNIWPSTVFEGLENSNDGSCSSDVNTLVYKNAGTIESLSDKVDKLVEQVNKSVLALDKNTASITEIQKTQDKYDKLTVQAASLANDNKERLMELAKQSNAKFKNAQSQYNKTGKLYV